MSDIGLTVAAARARAALSQRALAAAAGTAQPAVARIETGNVSPTIDTVERLIRAAGFDLEWRLVPRRGDDPVIDAYKRDVDRTLLRDALRKEPEARLRGLQELSRFADAARSAPRRRGAKRR